MKSIKNSRNNFVCEKCHYYTVNKYDFNIHLTTSKHQKCVNIDTLEIKSIKNPAIPFYCNKCNYTTTIKSNYDKHLLTEKHKKNIIMDKEDTKHICSQCKKEYINYSGLWKHRKQCIINNEGEQKQLLEENISIPTNVISPELVIDIINQSKELQNVLIE